MNPVNPVNPVKPVNQADRDPAPLSAVVVGTGFGVITHLRAMRAAGFDVRALVGRDAAKTATRAARFDVPHAATSLADALDRSGGVDVVAVTTPPHTHAALVLEAIAAGTHVMCEKPFARDLAEAQRMVDTAEAAGVVNLLGTEFRFSTGQALLTRVVRSGAIGEPRSAMFVLALPTLVDPAAQIPAWWGDADQGGGWLGAYGSHVVDQIRTTMGEIVAVSASLHTLAPRPAMTADDTFTVHFDLENGATGIMHSSCTQRHFVATTTISGTIGSAWLQGDDVFVDTDSGAGPQRVPVPADLVNPPPDPPPADLLVTTYDMWHSTGIDLAPFTRIYRVMRDRILGRDVADDPAAATFRDGAAAQAVLDAIRRSAHDRTRVIVDPVIR